MYEGSSLSISLPTFAYQNFKFYPNRYIIEFHLYFIGIYLKERFIHLNAEFQRIAKRDNKAFLSDQGKETEENNRMGKTRDHFKKLRDTKGTCHAMMGSIRY